MTIASEMRPDSGDETELEIIPRHKLRADTGGSRRKRQRWGERPTVINVVPAPDADLEEEEDRDPIIRVYSEDSAYVDTTMGESGGPGQRISFMMESAPSQDTEFTELRLSSFYSQDEILDTVAEQHSDPAPAAGDKPDVGGDQELSGVTTGGPGGITGTRTLVTMSSLASTEFDPFRSQDCLVRNGQHKPAPGTKRYSMCCINTIVDFVQALLYPDKFPPATSKVEPGDAAEPPGDMITGHQTRLMSNFRGEGRVTTGCLWHACRAVTIGIALIITGISLTIIGYLTDQREYLEHVELSRKFDNYTSTKYKDGRFHLSNISFSGPVVLGTGGFLLIVACVMTLEARDNAAKIVPATACLETAGTSRPNAALTSKPREDKFKTSASQTAILDKNIVAVLTGSQSPHSSSARGTGTQERQERRFSSGSAQLPGDNSGSGGGADTSDRDRQARTKAFVNGDCGLGGETSDSPGQLHKCPSAPCIINCEETRPDSAMEHGASVSFKNETQQQCGPTDKWLESI